MISIKVDGTRSKVVGDLLAEDDNYIYVQTLEGTRVKIPHNRVIYIEEEPASPPKGKIIKYGEQQETTKPKQEEEALLPLKLNNPSSGSAKKDMRSALREELQKKMTQPLSDQIGRAIMSSDAKDIAGMSQVDPAEPEPEYDSNDTTTVRVLFKGVKEGSFEIEVPKDLMNSGYTPSLGREVFKHKKAKSFLNGAMLAKLPEVGADYIEYTTKEQGVTKQSSPNTTESITDKLSMAGKIVSATSKITQQQAKEIATPRPQDFSMTASPFVTPPLLSVDEDNNK